MLEMWFTSCSPEKISAIKNTNIVYVKITDKKSKENTK